MKGRALALVPRITILIAGIVLAAGGPRVMTSGGAGRGSRTVALPPAKRPTPITQGARQISIATSYGKAPLSFEINRGQTDPRVKFLARGRGYALFLTSNEAVLSLRVPRGANQSSRASLGSRLSEPIGNPGIQFAHLPAPDANRAGIAAAVLRMRLVGANPAARVAGLEALAGKVNYFVGNDPQKWRTNVPTYARVRYEKIYPGVDLVYYGSRRQLEYDFIVAPGADPRRIELAFGASEKLALDRNGSLVLRTAAGAVEFHKPVAYQEVGAGREEIAAKYVLRSGGRARFEVGSYDRSRPLVIDPVLVYSTYLGGSGGENAFGIAVDASGNAYLVGATGSSDFPTKNAFQSALDGVSDAFVTKLDATGSQLVYSTYLGGSAGEVAFGVAVDSGGNAYVTGATFSSDFPTTASALQATFGGGGADAFVAKLDPTGSKLVYSTYLGGSADDRAFGIAADDLGGAYLIGTTFSANFPTSAGAFQTVFGGTVNSNATCCSNAFVTKIATNEAGAASLVYSTYLGGTASDGDGDFGAGVAIDSSGNAYVTGVTSSGNFPTVKALQPALSGSNCSPAGSFFCADAFVTKLNSSGTGLAYSTYLGGSSIDSGKAIAVDGSGNAYVTGSTASADFPTKNGIPNTTFDSCNACSIGFVSKLDATGSALVYSTYLGTEETGGTGIALDASGDAYVTGSSSFGVGGSGTDVVSFGGGDNCGGGDFISACPIPFMAELNPSGSAFVSFANLGGTAGDVGFGIAVDAAGGVYVAGAASSSDFPVTAGVLQVTNHGAPNGFVFKISPSDAAGVAFAPASLTFGAQPEGTSSAPQAITVVDAGSAALNLAISPSGDFSQSNNCGTGLSGATTCVISVVFTPTATGTRAGAITVTDNAAGSPQSLTLTGTATPPAPLVTLSPSSVDFGSQAVGTTSAAQPITVSNTGSATLNISSVAITGANSGEFALASGTTCTDGGMVMVGANCVINVTFTPSAAGDAFAAVTVTDNAADSPQSIALSGSTPPPDFSFAGSITSQTVSAGQTATFSLSLSGSNGFSGSVSFNCTGFPRASTCTITPNPVSVSGDAAVSAAAAVATTARATLLPAAQPARGVPPSGAVGLVLLLLLAFAACGIGRLGKPRRLAGAAVALAVLFAVLSFGCGGGGGGRGGTGVTSGTPAGTYAVNVTGTSGSTTHSLPLTLTVK